MTIGAGVLWWVVTLIGLIILTIIVGVILGTIIDDMETGMGISSGLAIIPAWILRICLIALVVFWIVAMVTTSVGPIAALSYVMW